MTVLERLETAMKNLKARGVSDGDIAQALKKIVHSPAVALLVALTPNKVDDAALEMLKALFPA